MKFVKAGQYYINVDGIAVVSDSGEVLALYTLGAEESINLTDEAADEFRAWLVRNSEPANKPPRSHKALTDSGN